MLVSAIYIDSWIFSDCINHYKSPVEMDVYMNEKDLNLLLLQYPLKPNVANELFENITSTDVDDIASNITSIIAKDPRLNLISINQPNFKSFKDLGNVILNIRKENLNLSGQKNYIKII